MLKQIPWAVVLVWVEPVIVTHLQVDWFVKMAFIQPATAPDMR